jgi:PadR family transcriptional regulator, regulatory protein PadR
MPSERSAVTQPSPAVLQGTLEMMIMTVLRDGERHGYGLAREIERRSGGVISVEEGSLYPALKRMSKRGDVQGEWRLNETGRRARFYRLTASGRRQLAAQTGLWVRFSGAVNAVLGEAGGPGRRTEQ